MKIKISKPEVIWKAKTFLGEGVLWVPSHNAIYFVDIKKSFMLGDKLSDKHAANKTGLYFEYVKNDFYLQIKKISQKY